MRMLTYGDLQELRLMEVEGNFYLLLMITQENCRFTF